MLGSVATGTDGSGSDIDLLFTMGTSLSPIQLGRLQKEIVALLGVPVDLVPDSALRPEFRDRVLSEVVAL